MAQGLKSVSARSAPQAVATGLDVEVFGRNDMAQRNGSPELESSFRHCEAVTKERAKNFYYGIKLLPLERRRALSAIYAFFRYCDDVSDGDIAGSRADLLQRWRAAIDPDAPANQKPEGRILPAYYDSVRRFQVPLRFFHEMIDGVECDLHKTRYANFEELYQYCYRVASTVGLVCLHVFGFDGSPEALKQAEQRGIAFQLTNILRDVAEDVQLGRIYLPLDELQRFGVTPDSLLEKKPEGGFADLLRFQVERAREYYRLSDPLIERVDAGSRASLGAMTSIYSQLLEKVAQLGPKVLSKRATLTMAEKLKLAGSTLVNASLGR